jgi:hypothetical protein
MHTLCLHFLHLMASHWRHLAIIQYQIEKIHAIQLFSATCAKMSLKILVTRNPFCSGCYNDCIQELEDFPIFPPRIPSSSSSSDNGIIIMIKINSEQRNANPRCSLCWEDFTVEERVADFPCNHIYHDPCIVTWFQTNNNCPICIRVFFVIF